MSRSRKGKGPLSVTSGMSEKNLKHYIFQGMDNNSTEILKKYDGQ